MLTSCLHDMMQYAYCADLWLAQSCYAALLILLVLFKLLIVAYVPWHGWEMLNARLCWKDDASKFLGLVIHFRVLGKQGLKNIHKNDCENIISYLSYICTVSLPEFLISTTMCLVLAALKWNQSQYGISFGLAGLRFWLWPILLV